MDRSDSKIAVNVDENYIFTTEDKIRILYDEYNSARKYSGDFLAFLGIFLSILITLVTCEFKDLSFMDASTVKALFVMAWDHGSGTSSNPTYPERTQYCADGESIFITG